MFLKHRVGITGLYYDHSHFFSDKVESLSQSHTENREMGFYCLQIDHNQNWIWILELKQNTPARCPTHFSFTSEHLGTMLSSSHWKKSSTTQRVNIYKVRSIKRWVSSSISLSLVTAEEWAVPHYWGERVGRIEKETPSLFPDWKGSTAPGTVNGLASF